MASADWFLIGAACVTSMIAAVGGIGGGVVLIAIMPGFLPASAIIPIHGSVQIASNLSRALLGIRHTDWRIVGQYAGGAAMGAWLGSRFLAGFETRPTARTSRANPARLKPRASMYSAR